MLSAPGPDTPAQLAALLQGYYDALLELQDPTKPLRLPSIDTKANLLKRAPAASFRGCAIKVDDRNCIALSTNVSGEWIWVRADGGDL